MVRDADDYVEFKVGYRFKLEIGIDEIIEYFNYLPEEIYGSISLSTGSRDVD
jgi:hypothetical protein